MKIQKIKTNFSIFIGLVILSFAVFTYAQNNLSSDKNIFQDVDQDGLSDEEEKLYGTDSRNPDTDGDGYSDGIEIKSGYDPLKPAPGDKLVKDNMGSAQVAGSTTEKNTNEENLTQELSNQAVELINKSQTENKDISIDDLDSIVDQIVGENLTFGDLPKIDIKTIKIKEQNYSNFSDDKKTEKEKEDTSQYLSAFSYIMLTNSPLKVSGKKDVEKISEDFMNQIQNFSSTFDDSYFKELAKKGESTLDQLNGLEVPENLLELHIKGLQLAKYGISLKDEVKVTSEDPAMSILNLAKVKNLINLTIIFSQEVEEKLSKLGISDFPINLEQ